MLGGEGGLCVCVAVQEQHAGKQVKHVDVCVCVYVCGEPVKTS